MHWVYLVSRSAHLAGQEMGLGTFSPPDACGERVMIHDTSLPASCLLAPAPSFLETRVSRALFMTVKRTFTCVSHTLFLSTSPTSCSQGRNCLHRSCRHRCLGCLSMALAISIAQYAYMVEDTLFQVWFGGEQDTTSWFARFSLRRLHVSQSNCEIL